MGLWICQSYVEWEGGPSASPAVKVKIVV